MTQYSEEQRTAAFALWCGEGDQSIAKTAKLTGITERTLYTWSRLDEWRARWLSTNAPEAEVAAAHGKTMIRYAMPLVAKRLIHIIGAEQPKRHAFSGDVIIGDDGQPVMEYVASDKDAVNAAKILSLYGWGHPLSTTEVGDTSILTSYSPLGELPATSANGDESVAELRRSASAMLEATVAAVNTRTATKGRRRV